MTSNLINSYQLANRLNRGANKLEKEIIPNQQCLKVRQKLIIAKNKMRLRAIYLMDEVLSVITEEDIIQFFK